MDFQVRRRTMDFQVRRRTMDFQVRRRTMDFQVRRRTMDFQALRRTCDDQDRRVWKPIVQVFKQWFPHWLDGFRRFPLWRSRGIWGLERSGLADGLL